MRLFNPLARGLLCDVFGGGAAVGGIAQAAGSVAAAGISAAAANHASDLTSQAAANSLQFNKDVYANTRADQAPFVQAGQKAVGQLSEGTQPGGQFTQTYGKTFDGGPAFDGGPKFDGGPAFTAPTGVDEQNDPGYQFRLQQGQQALERSAAARGGVMGGGVLKDLTNYSQGVASQEYGNVYNRALQGYQTNFNNNLAGYQTNFANSLAQHNTNFSDNLNQFNSNYNQFNNDQNTQFNRLSSLAGTGQTANGQLGAAGSSAASNYGQIAMGGANASGNYLTQGASAVGAGLLGAGNAINNNQQFQQWMALQNAGGGGSQLPNGQSYNVPYQPGYTQNNEFGDFA